MATRDEIQNEIDDLEARIEALQLRLPVTPNAKDRTAIRGQIDSLNEQISAKKRQLSTAAMATPRALGGTEIGLAASTLKNTLDNLARNADQAEKALRANPESQDAFNTLQSALTNLFRAENSAVSNGIQITPSVSLRNGLYVRTREGVTAAPMQAPAGAPAEEARRIGRQTISGPAIKEAP
jgi:chromosome segregation ATPase